MESKQISENFYRALDCADKDTVKCLLNVIKRSPREYPVYMVSCPSLRLRPDNESMHPYIKEFFDWGIQKFYERAPEEMANFYKLDSGMISEPTEYIMAFLNDYVSAKRQFDKEGKEICALSALKEYSFLRDYVESRNHFEGFKELVNDVKEKKYEVEEKEIQKVASLMLEVYEKNIEKESNNERHIPLSDYERIILAREGGLLPTREGRVLLEIVKMEMMKQSETYRDKIVAGERKERSEKIDAENKLEQFEKEIAEYKRSKALSVSVDEDMTNMTDAQRKETFDAKYKLMQEHPIMFEACLSSMCMAYHLVENDKTKKQMLADLYSLRKSKESNKDKREIAKAFQRVLDRTPILKKNENLVALSKIDTPFYRPTKSVKRQLIK